MRKFIVMFLAAVVATCFTLLPHALGQDVAPVPDRPSPPPAWWHSDVKPVVFKETVRTKTITRGNVCNGCTCSQCLADCACAAPDCPSLAEQLFVPQPVKPMVVNPPRPPQSPLPAYEVQSVTTEEVALKRGVFGVKKARVKSSRRTCGPGGCG